MRSTLQTQTIPIELVKDLEIAISTGTFVSIYGFSKASKSKTIEYIL